MNFIRLFKRDISWYLKPFVALSAAACLICAVLTSALLIGESVRGTLEDNLKKDTAFVKTLIRFSVPVKADIPDGVLHTSGFISPGIKTNVYAFRDHREIKERDAYCSEALAEALKLKTGETFTVRVQTIGAISSEELLGLPPRLQQVRLVYRGILRDKRADVNFANPQLRPFNLFLNNEFLSRNLNLEEGAINEVWADKDEQQALNVIPDSVIWDLSQLVFENWNDRPILKSKSYFIPPKAVKACPEAMEGLIAFAETLSDSYTSMNYFFVGAFSTNIIPVAEDEIIISDTVKERFHAPVTLTCFTTDGYRRISREKHVFNRVSTTDDSMISSVVSPDIPGLTDAADCANWKAEIPIDLKRIKEEDEVYWETYKSKPKAYLNFKQAQQIFAPGKCTLLMFKPDADVAKIKKQITSSLRHDPVLIQRIPVAKMMKENIQNGIQFAPLFLGLSFFIIISALLILWMLLKLHLFDRSEERRIYSEFVSCERKIRRFILVELTCVLLPGILTGLFIGTLLCLLQLRLLEHVWNGIIMMDRLNFHASPTPFAIAFFSTFFSSYFLLAISLRLPAEKPCFYIAKSQEPTSIHALGALSFFRRFNQYRLCVVLLVLGIVGTLGVGSFGIKVRGEDGFSYQYIAETALPVVPSYDHPFPPGGLPVRVYHADSADCSNLLRASEPTAYGCDLEKLTGETRFLKKNQAAADAGSLQWIMKKKLGDIVRYPNGSITLERALKASVFQRGILVGESTFEKLFPNVQGAQLFLIKDKESADAYRTYLEPFGVDMSTVDAFMAKAESVQNRYLTIFLQLGFLGFVLGIGSMLLMMIRNLHVQRDEIQFLSESGFPRKALFHLYLVENLWIYGSASIISLLILGALAFFTNLNVPILFIGWALLSLIGTSLIGATLYIHFRGHR